MSGAGSAHIEPLQGVSTRQTLQASATSWTAVKLTAALALTALGVLVTLDAWIDIVRIGWVDEEASHIFLVPIVAAWLAWSRRDQVADVPVIPSLLGPAIILVGGLLNWYGYSHLIQALWHGGSVLIAIGCFVTVVGHHVLWRLLPAFVVLGFLVPVPGLLRQQVALPLQWITAAATAGIYDAFALDIVRNGNVLRFNGVDVAVAEACNGMRMVFALILVTYAVAFVTPLKAWVRVLVLLLSPVFAIACNIVRLVPTVWLYGYYPETLAPLFHDLSGWVMIGVAWAMVAGLIALLRWLDIPVMQTADAAKRPADTARPSNHRVMKPVLAAIPAVLLLTGIGAVTLARPAAQDAEPYHAKVRQAVDDVPREFGDWTSRDVEVPRSAQELLRPNAMVSREYTNFVTGEQVSFFLVHGKDARDMTGHFPPNCYPNSGWTPQGAEPRTWTIDDVTLPGMAYAFSFHHPTGDHRMVVDNLLILPNGDMARSMREVTQAAADYTRRFYGAAQVQLLTPASMSEARRKQVFEEIIGQVMPVIRIIQTPNAPAPE